MKSPKPHLVDKYLEGIDPSKRIRHRGILRSFQYHDTATLDEIPDFIRYKKRKHPNCMQTPWPFFDEQEDGLHYFYMDEFITQSESKQEAAALLNRNRSTVNAYCKKKSFPYEKNIDGKFTIDVVAAQDWILWNTEHHDNLTPYWPDIEENILMAVHADELKKPEPLFLPFHAENKAA